MDNEDEFLRYSKVTLGPKCGLCVVHPHFQVPILTGLLQLFYANVLPQTTQKSTVRTYIQHIRMCTLMYNRLTNSTITLNFQEKNKGKSIVA